MISPLVLLVVALTISIAVNLELVRRLHGLQQEPPYRLYEDTMPERPTFSQPPPVARPAPLAAPRVAPPAPSESGVLAAIRQLSTVITVGLDRIFNELRLGREIQAGILIAQDKNTKRDMLMAKTFAEHAAEMQALQEKMLADLTETTQVVSSIEVVLDGQQAQISALKQQVIDLQAASGDPTIFQPLVDQLTAMEQTAAANRDRLKAAAIKGTEVDT